MGHTNSGVLVEAMAVSVSGELMRRPMASTAAILMSTSGLCRHRLSAPAMLPALGLSTQSLSLSTQGQSHGWGSGAVLDTAQAQRPSESRIFWRPL